MTKKLSLVTKVDRLCSKGLKPPQKLDDFIIHALKGVAISPDLSTSAHRVETGRSGENKKQ